MKAVLCPVCMGEGKVKDKECYGCGGKGWVEVGEDKTGYVPYPFYPNTTPWYPNQPYYPWYYDPWTVPYDWKS